MANSSNKSLEEIIQDFEDCRSSFRQYVKNGNPSKEGLLEYQSKFVDIKAELRPFHNKVVRGWTNRDDKSATAIKFRLAVAIHEGSYKGIEECSINQAEKYASATKEYKKFIDERAFWKESLSNINDLRDDIHSYTIEISNRLKLL